MYLASGTDEIYMKEEARLLGITQYFDGGVYGALDDYKSFSKAILIQRILASADFQGNQFLGFGDGYVEIEEVKNVGGVAVGVASEEPACTEVDQWKRLRLIGVGADYIVPNFLCREELVSTAFPCLMASKYQLFDRSRLRVKPLGGARERSSDRVSGCAWTIPRPQFQHADLPKVAERLDRARSSRRRASHDDRRTRDSSGREPAHHRSDGARIHRPPRDERRGSDSRF